jgi:hypothetical protein
MNEKCVPICCQMRPTNVLNSSNAQQEILKISAFSKMCQLCFFYSFKAVAAVLRLDEFNLFSNFQPKPNIKQNGKK